MALSLQGLSVDEWAIAHHSGHMPTLPFVSTQRDRPATFPATAVEVADTIACVSRIDAPAMASAIERVEERAW